MLWKVTVFLIYNSPVISLSPVQLSESSIDTRIQMFWDYVADMGLGKSEKGGR